MPTFAQQTPDENLVTGWNVQGNFTAAATVGVPPAGFAQAAITPPVTVQGQPNAGSNSQAGGFAPFETNVLVNGSYAINPTTSLTAAVTAPTIPASTVAAQSPLGVNSNVTITGGTVTQISVAPFNAGGASAATFTNVGTTTPATINVPPGGYIKMTYSVVPTSWTWTPTN